MFKKYLNVLNLVMLRPILFYTKLPAGDFKDEPVTFCAVTSWIVSFFISSVIFVNQLAPIGMTLWEIVKGPKIIFVLPVMTVLSLVFFIVVYSIVGGVLMAGMLALYSVLGLALHYGGMLMGGKAELKVSIKASLYAAAATVIMILPVLTMFLSKRGLLDFTNFKIGYNIAYSLFTVYLYGLMAIASRKTQGIERWRAFVAALLPAVILIVIGIVIGAVILPKFQSFVV